MNVVRVSFTWSELDAAEWIARFNLYVLPLLVVSVVLASYARGRYRPVDARRARARAVRLVGLCHYGLALRALLMVVPEWMTYRDTGAFASLVIVNVYWPMLMAALLPPLGLGLRRLQPWARWGAIALNGLLAFLAVLVSWWKLAYGAAIYAWDWPEVAAGRILPFFVLLVLLAPRTPPVFRAEDRASLRREAALARPSLFSLVALGALTILGAIVSINASDWLFRYALQSDTAVP